MMERKILVTGFEPFGGDVENPSGQLAARLDGARLHGRLVRGQNLPVAFGVAATELQRAIRRHHPEMVICLGLAAGRQVLSLERVALNLDDARIPDNQGQKPVDVPIRKTGATAYLSTLPIKAMYQKLVRAGWPVEVSTSAGTYVCNHVFYCLIHYLRRYPGPRGGFIHVPRPRPEFGLDAMEAALRAAIITAVRTKRDRRISAGREE